MAQCNDIGPSITPPADESMKDKILEILGVQEIEISKEDIVGEDVTLIVLGRVVEGE